MDHFKKVISMLKKFFYRWIFIAIIILAASPGITAQVQNIGKVLSYKKTSHGIVGKTSLANFYIYAYSENTIRVRVSKNSLEDNFSYALASLEMPLFNNFRISENGNTIEISTATVIMQLETTPAFRVTFKTIDGRVINEDVKGDGFGTTFIGEKASIYKVLQKNERFVGLGEALGNLDRRGTGVTLNNTDTYKYGDPRLSMYSSIPFYIGIQNQLLYGLFLNNSYKSFFNFGLSTPGFSSINVEGGEADYFFFYDTSVAKIIEHYSTITGTMPLPPIWSLGYHQSRCSYYPQSQVKFIAEAFRSKQIPIDCIVLDADYLKDYEPFRINTERFPDMKALSAQLAKMNIELTASVNPGIKIDSSYDAYHDGLKKDIFLKYSNGSLFVSDIAPNTNHYPDFTNPLGRKWWVEKMKFLKDNGINGYWNDMNEPATGGSYLPDNLLFDFDGRKANALQAKNVYGMQMARSSFEAALKFGKNKRPFILSRSGFSGIQRYASVWSGDNTANDENLLTGILLNNQMGLSGMPFTGYDVGGYIGDGTKDLFKRWIEIGMFSPYVRNHKEFFATANEPWSYGEEAEAISKTYINLRYRLMPYIYSTFYEASRSGMPVSRSLCINYPFDEKVYHSIYQYQFLFGNAMMIVPVTTKEFSKKIYLPAGSWYDIYSDEVIQGEKEWSQEFPIYQLPIFVKAGSVLPIQSQVQSTKDNPGDTLQVHIFYGAGENKFTYYEDDGSSFDYRNGNYCKRDIIFNAENKRISFSKQEGSYSSAFKIIKLVLHGFKKTIPVFRVNERNATVTKEQISLLNPLEFLGDIYDKNYYLNLVNNFPKPMQQVILFSNDKDEINITW